jgi:Flp pilus assembly protein TadD
MHLDPRPRATYLLAAPLLALAALLATLTLVNASSTPEPTSTADVTGRAPAGTEAQIAALADAAAADPENADAQAALGDAYYQRSRETGDPATAARAEDAYAAALAADSRNVTAISGQATIALARHDFAGGLELARRAQGLAPQTAAPYAPLVDALIETGRYDAAARALDRMLSLKPSLAAYSRLSYFRELNGDLRGASQALAAATSAGAGTAEGNAFIRSLRGDVEAARGNYVAAEQLYREALAIDSEFGAARSGLAGLAAGRGDLDRAIAELRQTLGSPASPDALTELGEAEAAAGRVDAARRHFAAAGEAERELLEGGSQIDAGLTLFEADHGERERAVRYGRIAWRSAPSVSAADAYAWALHRAGRDRAAARYSEEAMKLGSRDPGFLFRAGMIAKAAGERARARALLSGLLAQTPRFDPVDAPAARRALADLR